MLFRLHQIDGMFVYVAYFDAFVDWWIFTFVSKRKIFESYYSLCVCVWRSLNIGVSVPCRILDPLSMCRVEYWTQMGCLTRKLQKPVKNTNINTIT